MTAVRVTGCIPIVRPPALSFGRRCLRAHGGPLPRTFPRATRWMPWHCRQSLPAPIGQEPRQEADAPHSCPWAQLPHTVIRERYGRYGPANSALAVRVSLLWHVIYTVLRLRVLLLANGTPWFSAAALCIGIGGDGMRLFLPQKPFTYDLCLYTRVPRA